MTRAQARLVAREISRWQGMHADAVTNPASPEEWMVAAGQVGRAGTERLVTFNQACRYVATYTMNGAPYAPEEEEQPWF